MQIVTSVATQLLGEHSHSNNFVKRIMSLYLYANGAQRQVITVISHLGISESYNNLIAKATKLVQSPSASAALDTETRDVDIQQPSFASRKVTCVDTPDVDSHRNRTQTPTQENHTKPDRKPHRPRQPGTLRKLSLSMCSMAHGVASTGLFAMSYDNINMMFRAAEQIIGRTGKLIIMLSKYAN